MNVGAAVSRVLCHVLGYVYPAYQTFKAVQTNEEEAHTQWLTFWIVNTYFTVFELFSDYLFSTVIPFYYVAKVALLLWLVLPQFMGAHLIYSKVIAPYMLRYEEDIDIGVERLQEKSGQAIGDIGRASIRHLKNQSAEVIKLGIAQALATALQENGDLAKDPRVLAMMLEEKNEDPEPVDSNERKSLDLRDADFDDPRLASFLQANDTDEEEDDDY